MKEKEILEFKIVGNDIYCRRFTIYNGHKLILSSWFLYINTEYA